MKIVAVAAFILAGCILAYIMAKEFPVSPATKVEQQPVTPLVYCHAQGGEVVDGKCVPHRSKK